MLEKILNQKLEEIKPLDVESMRQAEERWKTVAKPLHSLGKLEEAVIRMAGIREDADFIMKKKGLVIFCADNGVVAEGVTQTGQEVTAIVADNFTKGATSVCIMAEKAGVDVLPVDIGMAVDVASLTDPSKDQLRDRKYGSRSGDDAGAGDQSHSDRDRDRRREKSRGV